MADPKDLGIKKGKIKNLPTKETISCKFYQHIMEMFRKAREWFREIWARWHP